MAITGGAYLVGREAIGMVIRLVGVVVVVREMGPSSYGLYAAAAAYVLVIATVAQMGTEVYLIRVPEEPDKHLYNQAFTFLLVSSVLITAVALALTVAFGSFLRPVGVLLPLRVLLLTIPINVLWAPAQACIERRFGYKQMGILEVVGDVVLYGTAIPLAVTGAGEWSLVAGFFAWQLWLLVGSLVMSGLRPRWEWSAETVRTLTRHGLGFSSSSWITQLGGLVNPIVVGTLVGPAGVGFVAFAQRLVDTIGFAKRGAYRLGMVALSKVPSEDKKRLRYGIEEGSLLQLVVLAVPFAAFALVARWVIPLVFGHQWVGTIPVYSVLAVSAILSGPILIQVTLLFTRGKNLEVALGHGRAGGRARRWCRGPGPLLRDLGFRAGHVGQHGLRAPDQPHGPPVHRLRLLEAGAIRRGPDPPRLRPGGASDLRASARRPTGHDWPSFAASGPRASGSSSL